MRELSGESGPWARLTWDIDGKKGDYQITDRDVLWGCRMVIGEGGGQHDVPEVLWTMAQRWVLVLHVRGRTGAPFEGQPMLSEGLFAEYMQYSQPINPIWREGGLKCPREHTDPSKKWNPCGRAQLDRRAFFAKATLDDLKAWQRGKGTRGVAQALAWFRGQETANPVPSATHFAAPFVVQGRLVSSPSEFSKGKDLLLVKKGVNWFATEKGATHWTADAVRLLPPSGIGPRLDVPLLASIPKPIKQGAIVGTGVGAVYLFKKLAEWLLG